ncbi:MAG TPA: prephenate dehydrogenase/arogenate dehydrogenase family protein [Micromonosporaceae bacterium]|jgi:prephenate dehydrogenase|nr:prephenate dehydrogenase/arogenate dehydrogenase family protein [Micromonosporaceae bacterium]
MRIAVVGLGLIGGSMLRAVAAAGHDTHGYDTDPATRAMARTAAGQARPANRWHVSASASEAAANADLVVLAVPWPAVAGVVDELATSGFSGLVTDVTSVKGPVRDVINDRWRRSGMSLAGYVGGHPMAGRETAGFAAGDAKLFRGAAWALCLEPDETHIDDWLDVATLATSLGARVVPTTAAEHDAAVAAISHVPHLVATALMRIATDNPLALSLGAGSFHDGTRVAASPAELSAGMCGGNAAAVTACLAALADELDTAADALHSGDPIAALRAWFAPATAARRGWPPAPSLPADLPVQPDVLARLGRAGGWITGVSKDRRTVTAVRPAD